MEMVVHQHIGMHCHAELFRTLHQQCQHAFKVVPVNEDGLAVVATLDDVVRVTGQGQAGLAGHGKLQKRIKGVVAQFKQPDP